MNKKVISVTLALMLGIFFISIVIIDTEDRSITGYATYIDEENVILHAPGEIIVKYKGEVEIEGLVENGITQPISGEKIVEDIELYNLKFDESVDLVEVVEELENMENVEYAEPNFLMISDAIPDDESYNSLYWPANVNAEAGWDLVVGNKEVIIAVLDTGVDWNHPDLAENIVNRSEGCDESIDLDGNGFAGDCRGYDFTDINVTNYINVGYSLSDGEDYNTTDNDPMDFDSHGTHVAGIAGAVGNNGVGVVGSCWNCSIMPVRSGFNIITNGGSSVGSLEIDDVASAIYYAADNNATIISMSFGGGDSATVRNAIEYAYSRGVIMVASSGNSGANSKQYPCGYEEVICVGATNSDNTGASYSNYGSWVDLVAPGTGIYSTGFDDRYVSLSGTSMSTPMVAGIIGLMRGLFNLNQSEIVTALKDTGTPIDFSGTSINQTNIYEAILSLDNINPEISLVSPIDGYSNLALNQTLVCGASDWQLSSIKLSVWDSNGLFYNETRIVSGISNESSFELTLEADTYNWNCFVEDVQSNGAYASENYSISTTGSSVNLDSPENNSYFNSNPVSFNCSVQNSIGNENSNMTFNILNESGLLHSKTVDLSGNSNQSTFNYSFSDQGDYIWSCSSYNVNGELSSGEDHIISYDSILPVVTLEGPASGLSFESNSQEMTFEFEVSEVSDCDLIVDGSERGSLNNALNGSITEDFSPEDYSWKISCEDPSGNVGDSEIRSFTVEEPEEVVEDEDDDEESEGGAGGGGGGAGASTPGSTVTSPAEVTPPVEEVVEEVVEQVQQEPVIEEVVEESGNTGITGNAVDGFDFDLSNLEKYRNRVNIFVVFLLAITGILFFRDYKYEKEISKEMDVLEKE